MLRGRPSSSHAQAASEAEPTRSVGDTPPEERMRRRRRRRRSSRGESREIYRRGTKMTIIVILIICKGRERASERLDFEQVWSQWRYIMTKTRLARAHLYTRGPKWCIHERIYGYVHVRLSLDKRCAVGSSYTGPEHVLSARARACVYTCESSCSYTYMRDTRCVAPINALKREHTRLRGGSQNSRTNANGDFLQD